MFALRWCIHLSPRPAPPPLPRHSHLHHFNFSSYKTIKNQKFSSFSPFSHLDGNLHSNKMIFQHLKLHF